ncbi:Tetraspanin-6 [Vitis vinifera]|uniref:Tetraspanin-6 n=1 Tax=Vitis vinifera TaxID=29760 RepID=A0A438G5C6_VITVI|nr:Tetraspanin-6 [Vitis vinifera]
MYRFSNTVIGFLNLFTLLASIPIIGGGLWMARSSTTCESFLQTPLLVVGFVVLIISLAGFIGACFNVAWALWFQGGGVEVPGRVYKEYQLEKYSSWLKSRIKDPHYWSTIRSCILGSNTCAQIASWTPLDYLERDMTPIQVIFFTFLQVGLLQATNIMQLCHGNDDDPRRGLLPMEQRPEFAVLRVRFVQGRGAGTHKKRLAQALSSQHCDAGLAHWYLLNWMLFRNTRRSETDYPYGENRMSKVRPRWDFYWWRWWYDRKNQLY